LIRYIVPAKAGTHARNGQRPEPVLGREPVGRCDKARVTSMAEQKSTMRGDYMDSCNYDGHLAAFA
jgi:hypothetical protein